MDTTASQLGTQDLGRRVAVTRTGGRTFFFTGLSLAMFVIVFVGFSRTYYRNAINNGLIPVECDTSGIREGDGLLLRIDDHGVSVTQVDDAGTEANGRGLGDQ